VQFSQLFSQVLNVTGPVFVLVLLGLVLRRTKLINEVFVQQASNLVFRATMPVMIAVGLMKTDISTAFDVQAGILFTLFSVVSFGLIWVWARLRVEPRVDRGVYVQGAFRHNCGMVGLALVVNQYGEAGLGIASFLLALHAFIFNIMSIFVLSYYSSSLKLKPVQFTLDIVKNPLILSVIVGIALNLLGIRFSPWIETSLTSFGSLTLTLGLICVGASLSLISVRVSGGVALSAALVKLIWIPGISAVVLIAMGVEGMVLGALVLFMASPTAAASVVMVRAAQGNHGLAATIVVLATLGSVVTVPTGLMVLKYFGYV
jgi:predicted permease